MSIFDNDNDNVNNALLRELSATFPSILSTASGQYPQWNGGEEGRLKQLLGLLSPGASGQSLYGGNEIYKRLMGQFGGGSGESPSSGLLALLRTLTNTEGNSSPIAMSSPDKGVERDPFSAGSSTTTPTQLPWWNQQQQNLFNWMIQQFGGGEPSTYPGMLYTPRTPEEQAFFSFIGQPSMDPVMARAMALSGGGADRGIGALRAAYPSNSQDPLQQSARVSLLTGMPAFTVDPAQREKYYETAFQNPAMREYEQRILPQTMEAASGAGFHSSDTLQNMARAGVDVETALAAQRANLLWQDITAERGARESAMERMLKALGVEQSVGATLAGAEAGVYSDVGKIGLGYSQLAEAQQARQGQELGTAGALSRQISNEQVASQLQRWLMGEPVGGSINRLANPSIQFAMSLLGLSPFGYAGTTNTQGPGLGYGFLSGQGGSALAGLAGSALSNIPFSQFWAWLTSLWGEE